jgi:hypothetical protein
MRSLAVVVAVVMLVSGAARAEDGEGGRTLRTAGAISMGVGGALGVATLGLVLFSRDANDEIERLSRTNTHDWSDEDQSLWDKAKRADRIAKITGIAAGATFVTGAVLYFIGWRTESAQVTVAPARGGATMGFSCAF